MMKFFEDLDHEEYAAIVECARMEISNETGMSRPQWMDMFKDDIMIRGAESQTEEFEIQCHNGEKIIIDDIISCSLFKKQKNDKKRFAEDLKKDHGEVDTQKVSFLVNWASRQIGKKDQKRTAGKEIISDHKFQGGVDTAWSNNHNKIFGAIGRSTNSLTMRFYDQNVVRRNEKMRTLENEIDLESDKETLEISLSPEHYMKFIRAQSCEVPCSIGRYDGQIMDQPKDCEENEEISIKAFENEIRQILEPAKKSAKMLAYSLSESSNLNSRKKIQQTIDLIDETEALFDECEQKLISLCQNNTHTIDESMKDRFQKLIEGEIEKLPESQKTDTVKRIGSLLTE